MSQDNEHFPDMSSEDAAIAKGQTAVVESAFTFLKAFYTDGNLEHAWTCLSPRLRLCWAQWWGHSNEEQLRKDGFDAVAEAQHLARVGPQHDLWEGFKRAILRDFRAAFPLDATTCGIGMAPRPLAPDVELLYAHREIPADGLWSASAASSVVCVVMQFADGAWTVANLGRDCLPVPGWPPLIFGSELS